MLLFPSPRGMTAWIMYTFGVGSIGLISGNFMFSVIAAPFAPPWPASAQIANRQSVVTGDIGDTSQDRRSPLSEFRCCGRDPQ